MKIRVILGIKLTIINRTESITNKKSFMLYLLNNATIINYFTTFL